MANVRIDRMPGAVKHEPCQQGKNAFFQGVSCLTLQRQIASCKVFRQSNLGEESKGANGVSSLHLHFLSRSIAQSPQGRPAQPATRPDIDKGT
jgi:hypothetical protein